MAILASALTSTGSGFRVSSLCASAVSLGVILGRVGTLLGTWHQNLDIWLVVVPSDGLIVGNHP